MQLWKTVFAMVAVGLITGMARAEYLPLRSDVFGEKPDVAVLKQNSREVQLEIRVPGLERFDGILDGKKWDRVEIPGGNYDLEFGAPEVPHFTRMLVIPTTAAVHGSFEALETFTIPNVLLMPLQMDEPEELDNQPIKYNQEIYTSNQLYPSRRVMVGEPAIIRGQRVVALRTNPVQYNPVTHELIVTTRYRITVRFDGQDFRNVPLREVALSRTWGNMLRATSFNMDDNIVDDQNMGSYLIICVNNSTLINDIQSLIDWKKRKGHTVSLQTVASGASSATIKNVIQTAYNSADPPEFLLLMGDVSGTYALAGGSGSSSDHGYAQLDGSDVLEDIAMGRLSTDNQTETQTMVNKVLFYEKMPYTGDSWFSRSALVANFSNSLSMTQVNRYCKTLMLQAGYTQVDTFFSTSSPESWMASKINNGVTFINYRGWIYMGGFDNNTMNGLSNGRKMPFGTFLTCSTGGFSGDSNMEYFVIVGSPSLPKGGIACVGFYGSSTHVPQNNIINYGIYAGLFSEGLTQAGTATLRGKVELYNAYWTNFSSSVTSWTTWTSLEGDPGVELFTGPIQFMNCAVPDQVVYGVNTLSLTVTRQLGGALEDATVCLYKADELQSVGLTDANGQITLPLTVNTAGNVKVTITKHNYYPIVDSLDVVSAAVAVGYQSHTVDDDNLGGTSGDNDHVINPGETVDLPLTFKNFGTSTTATGISTTGSETNPYATLSNTTQSFPDMSPGMTGNSSGSMRMAVAAQCPDGHIIPLTFNTTSNQGSWTGGVSLPILSYNMILLNAQASGSDTLLSPNETANLTLTVRNVGHKTASNLTATLVSLDPLVTVNDNSASFGTVNIGGNANCSGNPFNLTASYQAMRGHWASLQVTYSANGAVQVDTFRIKLGNKLVTDPQGPDEYGYYCYDNGDVSYPQKPTYSWVEIDPGYGGSGTQLSINDPSEDQDQSVLVNLPFTFRYYGTTTNQITVCSNGWISTIPDISYTDFRNFQIPGVAGPFAHICPFWDDLVTTSSGKVFSKNDAANHRFIVQWSRMLVRATSYQEVIQVILYDPAYYPTPTGDGEIVFQYNVVNDVPGVSPGGYTDNQYSTVGIESPDQTDGIQVVYWNTYGDPAAAHLQNQRAYKFTTAFGTVPLNLDVTLTPSNPPIVIPANGGSFNFTAGVVNVGPTQAPFWVWARIKNPDGTYTAPTVGPVTINPPVGVSVARVRTQNVPSTWAPGLYTYLGYGNTAIGYPAIDSSSFTFTKSTTADGGPTVWEATCGGELFPGEVAQVSLIPTEFGLGEARPNPFNPSTAISYKLQVASHVSLKVYDTTGRLVTELVNGRQEGGSYQVTFDGSKISSGLYFVRMEAGDFSAVRKLMLVK